MHPNFESTQLMTFTASSQRVGCGLVQPEADSLFKLQNIYKVFSLPRAAALLLCCARMLALWRKQFCKSRLETTACWAELLPRTKRNCRECERPSRSVCRFDAFLFASRQSYNITVLIRPCNKPRPTVCTCHDRSFS